VPPKAPSCTIAVPAPPVDIADCAVPEDDDELPPPVVAPLVFVLAAADEVGPAEAPPAPNVVR